MSNQGQTTEMMTMMNMRIQNLTQESKRKADIDEARFGLDKEERDKKSMFTIKAAQVPAGMKPQNFKATFPGKNIGSITTQDLTRFVETIFVFTETISENARDINEFIFKLIKHCYSRGSESWSAKGSNVESIVNIATENYKNNRSCHTKERESPETDYSTLSTTQRRLGEQMCMYCLSLFDPSDPEIQQFKARVRQHQELMTYTEFILFLFYTKSGSPIMMWSRQSDTLKGLEAKLITDYRSNSMSAIREQVGVLLDELETSVLQPWQVAVTKIHSFAVQTGSKKAVEHLDNVVMNFLSEASHGAEIHTPNIREWTNQVMNIIDADKEYYESRKTEGKKRGLVQDMKPQPPDVKQDVKPKNVEVKVDQVNSVTHVPGKCSICSKSIMGPADKDHPERTYHTKCQGCFKPRVRFSKSKPVGQAITEDDVSEEGPLGCFNDCVFNEEKQCFIVEVDMSQNRKSVQHTYFTQM
jgi:hypothetical protein